MATEMLYQQIDSGDLFSRLLTYKLGLASVNSALKHTPKALVYVFIIGNFDIR